MRFDPWTLALSFVAAVGSLGCGDDPSASDDETPMSAAESDGSEASAEPHLEVNGRGRSAKLSAVLDVVEGEEASRLSITGSDEVDNVIAIYVTFHGVDTVVGSHVFAIGTVADAEVFAVGSFDGRAYQSESGELRMSISSDGHAAGEFEAALALDETVPFELPRGAPAPTAPAAAALTLAGTFASEWRVNCRSYVSGFTGGHAVSDSPYCQALSF